MPRVVNMAKDLSRKDAQLDDDNNEEEDIIANEIGPKERLDIEIVDWKPHKPGAIQARAFHDPVKYPRFQPPDSDEEEEKNRPTLSPKWDVLRERNVNVVDMSKQVGRVNSVDEKELVVRETGEELDQQAARAVAKARAVDIGAAVDLTSKVKRGPALVDMSRQLGRDPPRRRGGTGSEDEDGDDDDNNDPYHDIQDYTFGMGIGKGRVVGGVGVWEKEVTRKEEEENLDDDSIMDDVKLDLDADITATSK